MKLYLEVEKWDRENGRRLESRIVYCELEESDECTRSHGIHDHDHVFSHESLSRSASLGLAKDVRVEANPTSF